MMTAHLGSQIFIALSWIVALAWLWHAVERLARRIRECLGEDILRQVQEAPGWRNGLEATREKLASRWERQAA